MVFVLLIFIKYIDLYLGDSLVQSFRNQFPLPYPGNIEWKFSYSGSVIINYVEVFVNQTSILGQVDVLDGGIGSKHIDCSIRAEDTSKFSFEANIFGH